MAEERGPVEWDDDTDLNSNTIAASNKVKYFIGEAIDGLIDRLCDEGMDVDNKQLVWQLVGMPLRYAADAMEAAMELHGIEVEQVENRDSKPG